MSARRLIVCSDGTWNWPDQKHGPTNVPKVLRAIRPVAAGGVSQIVFYDSGVGTGNWVDRVGGGALGWGLGENVRQAYGFISDNYDRERGDDLFLFGFSRGAFTVRSLAGMICCVGLLPKNKMHLFERAWKYYRMNAAKRDDSDQGKRAFFDGVLPRPTKIRFIGVWDTVGSLGVPFGPLRLIGNRLFRFHDTSLCCNIERAYQALAIDERRRSFEPVLWRRDTSGAFQQRLAKYHIDRQILEQTWFAGVHSNVGGGYKDSALAVIALDWMVTKAMDAGLDFDGQYLANIAKDEKNQELKNSRTWRWWLRRPLERQICATDDDDERIHHSVLARMKRQRSEIAPHPYQPGNVEEARGRLGDRFERRIDNTGAPAPAPAPAPREPALV